MLKLSSSRFFAADPSLLIDAVVVEEEPDEDKNRKVRRSLEAGDVIESVFNISRIVGLDACGE